MDWVNIADWISKDKGNCVFDISPYFCDVEAGDGDALKGVPKGVVTLRTSYVAVSSEYIHQEDNAWLACKLVQLAKGAPRLDAKATSKGPALYEIGGLCGIEHSVATPVDEARLKAIGQLVSLANFQTVQTVKRNSLLNASVKVDTSTRAGIKGYYGLARMRDIYSPKLAAALLAYSETAIAKRLNEYHLYHGIFAEQHGVVDWDTEEGWDKAVEMLIKEQPIEHYHLDHETTWPAIKRFFNFYDEIDAALENGFIEEGDVESEPLTVYRGTKFSSPEAFLASFKSGVKYSHGYMSTSPRLEAASAFVDHCCLMKIEVPAGTPMLSLSIESQYRHEDEILLPHATVLRLKNKNNHTDDVEHTEDGKPIFEVIAEYRGKPVQGPTKSACRHTIFCDIVPFKKTPAKTISGPEDVEEYADYWAYSTYSADGGDIKSKQVPAWYALRAHADHAEASGMKSPAVSLHHGVGVGWEGFRRWCGLPEFRHVHWVSPSPSKSPND